LEELWLYILNNQTPNFKELTELEFIWYSVSFDFYRISTSKEKTELIKIIREEISSTIEFFSLESADLKTLLYDISRNNTWIRRYS
jgi:hypothetical protein